MTADDDKPRKRPPPRTVILHLDPDKAAAVLTACESYGDDPGAALGEHALAVVHEIERQLHGDKAARVLLAERAARTVASTTRELVRLAPEIAKVAAAEPDPLGLPPFEITTNRRGYRCIKVGGRVIGYVAHKAPRAKGHHWWLRGDDGTGPCGDAPTERRAGGAAVRAWLQAGGRHATA